MAKQYLTHGDYLLKELNLISYSGEVKDIREMFRSIQFTEDIFSNTIHGKLTMVDGIDFHQYFPIIGEEKIELRFTTDNQETDVIQKTFRVYRLSEKEEESNNLMSYVLYFVSEEALHNENVLVSKSYKNKKISFIVRDLFEELGSDKKFDIDSTKNSHHIVIPNWTPFKCINWCASFAMPDQYDGSLFLFYENRDGFNFKHVENLIDQDSILYFENKLANTDNDEGAYPPRSIITYKVLNTPDVLDGISEGMFGTRVIAYDNVSKQIQEFKYDYNSDFNRTSHMSSFKLTSDSFPFANPNQRSYLVPTKTFRSDADYFRENEGQGFSEKLEEATLYRSSLLSQLTANQFQLGLFGDTRLTCGVNIDITQENYSGLEGQQREGDQLLRGKVLLAKMTHTITPKKYSITATALKDSYDSQPKFNL